jgi:hypothetical protein
VVCDYFHTSSGKRVYTLREWWKVEHSSDIQMEGFNELSEEDSSVPEPKSDDEITLFFK